MDKALFKKVRNIIRNEFGLGRSRVETSCIYDKLVEAGVDVPESSLSEIVAQLEKERLITTEPSRVQEGSETHGSKSINWASRDI